MRIPLNYTVHLHSIKLVKDEMALRQDYNPVFPKGKETGVWLWPPLLGPLLKRE